jgi:hypothetical protein
VPSSSSSSPSHSSSVAGSKPAQVSIFHKDDFWLGFQEYLSRTYNKNTAKIRMLYAKKFYRVLLEEENNAIIQQDLLTIESREKRLNVMKSLTVLSKYLGCYDRWQEMRRRYNLKWSNGD